MPLKLVPSSRFIKQSQKIVKKHPHLRSKINQILKDLHINPQQLHLKFHKVGGHNNWAVSVTHDIRIIIHWAGDQLYLTNIGTHDHVY
jgi:mRNA-degrading endonuclease YafQ of YafQ-DinJ toxin-antitoxin module